MSQKITLPLTLTLSPKGRGEIIKEEKDGIKDRTD